MKADYLTVFQYGKEKQSGRWMAWVEFNNKIIKKTYCLSKKHAMKVRNEYVNKFWNFRLN